jgi:hypothetical protein
MQYQKLDSCCERPTLTFAASTQAGSFTYQESASAIASAVLSLTAAV